MPKNDMSEVRKHIGRPKGSKNMTTRKKARNLAREMIEDKSPMIVKKVITMGLEGDVQCLKMLMDRIVPQHKSVDVKQTKQDFAININVESLEQLPKNVVDVIDMTDEAEALERTDSSGESLDSPVDKLEHDDADQLKE